MDIEKMKTVPVINIPKRSLFEVCKELNSLAFPVSRRDDALFYLRPDMCIKQKDFDAVLGEDSRPWQRLWALPNHTMEIQNNNLNKELIYIPTESDLFHETPEVNQLTLTNTAGWFAYTGLRPQEDADYFRGNGGTPWFAIADAWVQIKKWKLGTSNAKPGMLEA